MKTETLVNVLKDIILNAYTPLAECKAEAGIHFLSLPPMLPTPGLVFAGTLSEWKILLDSHLVCAECTYLVCTNGETVLDQPPDHIVINLLILNASVTTTLHKLTALLLKKVSFSDADKQRLYMDFWNGVMDGALNSRELVTAAFARFPHAMQTHVACIVVSSERARLDPLQIREADKALKDFFPQINLFRFNKEWIILYSQSRDTSVELDISYEDFSQLLEKHALYAGISYVCQLPEQYRTLYLTASYAIKIGRHLKIEPHVKRIYTYYQYNPYYLIHLGAQKFREIHNTDNLVYLCHPDVIRLYYYDLENKNNLLDVLSAYLSTAQHIGLTAKSLFMHRNTVLNKLNKIEEVLGHKPITEENHFLMLLSCMIVKYMRSRREITEFFPLE